MTDDGSRCVTAIAENSEFKHTNFRVTGVHKALASVAAICDRGQSVVFDNGGSYIFDKRTGTRTPFEREDDVYRLNVHIPRPQPDSADWKLLAPVEKSIKTGAKAAKRSFCLRLSQFLP